MANVVRAALVQQKWTGDREPLVYHQRLFHPERRPGTCGPLAAP